MNAQGETWTAESVVQYFANAERDVWGETLEAKALDKALAIVRLHPELVKALINLTCHFTATGDFHGTTPNPDEVVSAKKLLRELL